MKKLKEYNDIQKTNPIKKKSKQITKKYSSPKEREQASNYKKT